MLTNKKDRKDENVKLDAVADDIYTSCDRCNKPVNFSDEKHLIFCSRCAASANELYNKGFGFEMSENANRAILRRVFFQARMFDIAPFSKDEDMFLEFVRLYPMEINKLRPD